MDQNEHTDEIASLEHTYEAMTGQRKNGRKKHGCCGVLLLAFLLALVGFMVFCFWGNAHSIPPAGEEMPYNTPQ